MTKDTSRLFGPASIVLLTTGATLIVRILSSITLTRLLAPDAFGLVGVINAIFFAITMMTDIGIQSYLVRHAEGDNPRFRDVIWTVHLWRSILLLLLAIAAAPVMATLLDKPGLQWPLIAASTMMLFAGLTSLAPITEIRAGRIGRLSLFDLSLSVLQTIATILLAIWLRSAWAIIIAMIGQSAVRAALSYAIFPDARRRIAFDASWSREMLGFSRVVLVSSTLTLALSQADKFALARLLTLHDFGFYAIALNLAAIPVGFLTAYVARVLYPAYARCWNEERALMPHRYYAVRREISWLYALATGALVGGATMLVVLLYDARYLAVGPYLSLLAISCVLRFPNLAATEVMTAMGQVQITLYANVVRLLWLGVAGVAGYVVLGPFGIVAAVGLIELPAMMYCWVVLRRAGLFDLGAELAYLVMALMGCAVGFGLDALLAGVLR